MTTAPGARLSALRLVVTLMACALMWGSGVWAGGAVAQAAPGDPVTYVGPNFGTTANNPTADKPQSKLWYADGAWWGLLVSASDNLPHVHELMPNHTWRDTGAVVDQRADSTGDALWAGGKLYIASRNGTSPLRVIRMSYDSAARSWSLDPGFPAQVPTGGGSESATIDRDSLGRLWVTYTRNSSVWVSHTSPGNDTSWVAPFRPAVPDVAINADDISALIRMPGEIGVMWSDQGSSTMWFARHKDTDPDSVWTVEPALQGPGLADDHINLKSIDGDSRGRVYAAVKTSATSPGDTLLAALVRTPRADGTGQWSVAPVRTVPPSGTAIPTRPIIMVDETSQELYFFYTSSESGGTILHKRTALASPSFPSGDGLPFVHSPGQFINNASGSKQSVTAATGLVVLANDSADNLYYHAEKSLAGGGGGADTSAPSVPTGLSATAAGPTRVDLAWNASTDDTGVAGYVVRRNGAVLAEVTGRTYADTTATAGTTYSYTVAARDAANNTSAQSGPVSITTPTDTGGGGTGGSISLAGATTGTNAATNTLVVPSPAAPAGAVLLAAVQVRGAPTITPPAGWQLVRMTPTGTSMRLATYWHAAGGTEPAAYTWTFSSAQSATGSVLAYTGVSPTAPIDTSAGQANASSTSVTAPSIATTAADAQVVGLFANTTLTSFTPPAGMTERSDIASPSTVTYKVTGASADTVLATPGATGTKTATALNAGPSVGQLIALRPL